MEPTDLSKFNSFVDRHPVVFCFLVLIAFATYLSVVGVSVEWRRK